MAPEHKYHGVWLALGWSMVAALVWLSLAPPSDGMSLINDKLAHAIAYFSLMTWFGQLHAGLARVALALLMLGALLEILQGMTGYRDMSLADLAADAIGIGLGWIAAARWPRLLATLEARLP